MSELDKELLRSLKREDEFGYDMLLRLKDVVAGMEIDPKIANRKAIGIDFPPETLEVLAEKSKDTGIPVVQLVLRAARIMAEQDGK